jgi:hypothetical protein
LKPFVGVGNVELACGDQFRNGVVGGSSFVVFVHHVLVYVGAEQLGPRRRGEIRKSGGVGGDRRKPIVENDVELRGKSASVKVENERDRAGVPIAEPHEDVAL